MKYVRNLSNADDRIMSTSPQINKENRPFVGIVIVCDSKPYCIPLSSPKEKHKKMSNDKDFSKILDNNGKLIGVLNFNNMIPIHKSLVSRININPQRGDTPGDRAYKQLLRDQLFWCNDNIDNIVRKANKLYKLVTEAPEKVPFLTRRCCDFMKLEQILEKWLEQHAEV